LDIEIIERAGRTHVRVQFSGAYQQPQVNWQADIMTLEHYCRQHPGFLPEYRERTALMEVNTLDSHQRHVIVALPMMEITHAEVIKSTIMVRNYRSMTVGLRQWRT